jgi:isopentenyl diphosphate isomerase/L-lactate dehydrogenase-like FMN-dependent dehydrogenase
MGEAGVLQALQVMQKELDVTMALTGIRDVKSASHAMLRVS